MEEEHDNNKVVRITLDVPQNYNKTTFWFSDKAVTKDTKINEIIDSIERKGLGDQIECIQKVSGRYEIQMKSIEAKDVLLINGFCVKNRNIKPQNAERDLLQVSVFGLSPGIPTKSIECFMRQYGTLEKQEDVYQGPATKAIRNGTRTFHFSEITKELPERVIITNLKDRPFFLKYNERAAIKYYSEELKQKLLSAAAWEGEPGDGRPWGETDPDQTPDFESQSVAPKKTEKPKPKPTINKEKTSESFQTVTRKRPKKDSSPEQPKKPKNNAQKSTSKKKISETEKIEQIKAQAPVRRTIVDKAKLIIVQNVELPDNPKDFYDLVHYDNANNTLCVGTADTLRYSDFILWTSMIADIIRHKYGDSNEVIKHLPKLFEEHYVISGCKTAEQLVNTYVADLRIARDNKARGKIKNKNTKCMLDGKLRIEHVNIS